MRMAAVDLHELVGKALEITGPAEWCYGANGEDFDRLEWVPGDDRENGTWVLCCPPDGGDAGGLDDIVLEEAVARDLLAAHFRRWLAERGWQVQMGLRRGKCFWRLADCLGIPDGGGDRLDADYPQGPDELAVLCEAVDVVTRAGRNPVSGNLGTP
jgi:hypothetical protein